MAIGESSESEFFRFLDEEDGTQRSDSGGELGSSLKLSSLSPMYLFAHTNAFIEGEDADLAIEQSRGRLVTCIRQGVSCHVNPSECRLSRSCPIVVGRGSGQSLRLPTPDCRHSAAE